MAKILRYGIKTILSIVFLGFPAFVGALIAKIFVRDLWLVGECGYFARDNGYYFFKYLRKQHPEQKVVFVIAKKSKHYDKVK